MRFTGYQKMTDTPDAWRLDAAAHRRLARARWVVTEKIHGANFCFVVDGREVRGANRRELLAEGDPFFGWQAVRDRLRPALLAAFAEVRALTPGLRRLFVFGELFGGGYPHPDVAPVPGVQPVQTGVWYAPGIEFCAFDMAAERDGASGRAYLAYETVMRVAESVGLPCAAPLLVGSYTDAMNLPLGFDSRVPARLNLPGLPPGTNKAEGVVVKPLRELTLGTPAGPIRPILKRKIPEFAEDDRYSGAMKWEPSTDSAARVERLRWEVAARLNANRLAAAVSKVGYRERRRDPSRASLLFALLVAEVLDEVAAAEPDPLTAAERDALRAHAADGTRALLRTLERPV
jgi:Rnl2 family RNA ligase